MSEDLHRLHIAAVEDWAARSADLLAEAIEAAIASRERCVLAVSGGSTPRPVLVELATRDLLWERVVLLQVDERLAPAGSADRNATNQLAALGDLGAIWLPLPVDQLMAAMPTLAPTAGDAEDPVAPADGQGDEPPVDAGQLAFVLADFTARLIEFADEPPIVDVVQLGIGVDGHTASLFGDDPAIGELRRYVALTGRRAGFRRLTLTRPIFDRARLVIWLATGQEKAEPLSRVLSGDLTIPAGMIRPRRSLIMVDTEAARQP